MPGISRRKAMEWGLGLGVGGLLFLNGLKHKSGEQTEENQNAREQSSGFEDFKMDDFFDFINLIADQIKEHKGENDLQTLVDLRIISDLILRNYYSGMRCLKPLVKISQNFLDKTNTEHKFDQEKLSEFKNLIKDFHNAFLDNGYFFNYDFRNNDKHLFIRAIEQEIDFNKFPSLLSSFPKLDKERESQVYYIMEGYPNMAVSIDKKLVIDIQEIHDLYRLLEITEILNLPALNNTDVMLLQRFIVVHEKAHEVTDYDYGLDTADNHVFKALEYGIVYFSKPEENDQILYPVEDNTYQGEVKAVHLSEFLSDSAGMREAPEFALIIRLYNAILKARKIVLENRESRYYVDFENKFSYTCNFLLSLISKKLKDKGKIEALDSAYEHKEKILNLHEINRIDSKERKEFRVKIRMYQFAVKAVLMELDSEDIREIKEAYEKQARVVLKAVEEYKGKG